MRVLDGSGRAGRAAARGVVADRGDDDVAALFGVGVRAADGEGAAAVGDGASRGSGAVAPVDGAEVVSDSLPGGRAGVGEGAHRAAERAALAGAHRHTGEIGR